MTAHFVFSRQCTEFFFSTKAQKAAISKKTVIFGASQQSFGPSCFVSSLVSGYIDFTLYEKYFDTAFPTQFSPLAKLAGLLMGDDIGSGLSSMVVCFDFRSTMIVQISNRNLYFYQFRSHHPLSNNPTYFLPNKLNFCC